MDHSLLGNKVLVLDDLQHHVTSLSLENYLYKHGHEQGITWEKVYVMKKSYFKNSPEADEKQGQGDDESVIVEEKKSDDDNDSNNNNNHNSDKRSSSSNGEESEDSESGGVRIVEIVELGPRAAAAAQNEEEEISVQEDGHGKGKTSTATMTILEEHESTTTTIDIEKSPPERAENSEKVEENEESKNDPDHQQGQQQRRSRAYECRGFIYCLDSHVATFLLNRLYGQRMFGRPLKLRLASETDIQVVDDFQAAQLLVPKILVRSTSETSSSMQIQMLQDLCRVLKWCGSVHVERVLAVAPDADDDVVEEAVEETMNDIGDDKFMLTVPTNDEAFELVELLKDVNFYEFKIKAKLIPVSELHKYNTNQSTSKELVLYSKKPKYYSRNSFNFTTTSDFNSTDSGIGRCSFSSDASFSNSSSSSLIVDPSTSFNYSSIHIVPKSWTAAILSSPSYKSFVPMRYLIPEKFTRCIIGMNGQIAETIAETSGASVAILEKVFHIHGTSWNDKVLILFGPLASTTCALRLVLQVLSHEIDQLLFGQHFSQYRAITNELITEEGVVYWRMVTFNSITGRLIGKFGRNLKDLMQLTNTHIAIESTPYNWGEFRVDSDRVVEIIGSFENVLYACEELAKRLHAAFNSEYKYNNGVPPGEGVIPSPFVMIPNQQQPPPGAIVHQNFGGGVVQQPFYGAIPPPPSSALTLPAVHPSKSQTSIPMLYNHPSMGGMGLGMGVMPPQPQLPPPNMIGNGLLEFFDPTRWTISHIYCPNKAIHKIIGPKASNIHYIRETTNVLVEINNATTFKRLMVTKRHSSAASPPSASAKTPVNSETNSTNNASPSTSTEDKSERQLILSGPFQDHSKAQYLVYTSVERYYKLERKEKDRSLDQIQLTVEFGIPTKYVARIIGKQGHKLQQIENDTCTFIQFNTEGFIKGGGGGAVGGDEFPAATTDAAAPTSVKVLGTYDGVQQAQARIYKLVKLFHSKEMQDEQQLQMRLQQQQQQLMFHPPPPHASFEGQHIFQQQHHQSNFRNEIHIQPYQHHPDFDNHHHHQHQQQQLPLPPHQQHHHHIVHHHGQNGYHHHHGQKLAPAAFTTATAPLTPSSHVPVPATMNQGQACTSTSNNNNFEQASNNNNNNVVVRTMVQQS